MIYTVIVIPKVRSSGVLYQDQDVYTSYLKGLSKKSQGAAFFIGNLMLDSQVPSEVIVID